MTLTCRPYSVREHLTDVHPDDCALRKRERGNVTDERPDDELLVLACGEHHRNDSQANARSDRADEQIKKFNPLIANIQLYYYLKSNDQEILSDEEAALIAEENSTKDADDYLLEILDFVKSRE
jgi:hypothetical protein